MSIEVQVISLLAQLFDHDKDKMKAWLNKPLPAWYGITPIELIQMDNAQAVVTYLEYLISREVSN